MFNQSTGAKGEQAEKDLESFMRKSEIKFCIECPVRKSPVRRHRFRTRFESSFSFSSSSSEYSSSSDTEIDFQITNLENELQLYELEEHEKREE